MCDPAPSGKAGFQARDFLAQRRGQAVAVALEVLADLVGFLAPGARFHGEQLREGGLVDVEPGEILDVRRGNGADRRLDAGGLALAAVDDPGEHAQVLAVAGPQEAALTVAALTGRVGYERLGGTGAIGFSTPLATLHKFQGFADVFLTTPTSGVEDLYGGASYEVKDGPFGASATLYVVYHDFESERGAVDFGREFDAGANVKIAKRWSVEVKGAVYRGDGAFADRSVIWTSLRFQY